MKYLTIAAFACALCWGMNSSLSEMTQHDCEVNKIELACEDLRK